MFFSLFSRNSRDGIARRQKQVSWSINKLEPRVFLAGDAGAAVANAVDVAPSNDVVVADTTSFSTLDLGQAAEIVFVDSDVADLTAVADPVTNGAQIVILDSQSNGVEQIQQYLADRSGVKAIHIVSHGSNGQLQLGATQLNHQSLSENAQSLRDWAGALTSEADILIYGCDVAADEIGRDFLREIARLTGADIAASSDRTGNADVAGDWILETTIGNIETSIVLAPHAMRNFDRHLGIDIIAGGTTGDELLELHIDGEVVDTWFLRNTDANQNQLLPFSVDIDGVDPSRISLHFVNDLFDPANNIDRNVRVDAIIVDGVRIEAEDSSVFSTGTFRPEDGFTPGNGRGEFLHGNGFFQFSTAPVNDGGAGNNGSIINIFASGDTGEEQAQLLIDGQVVQTFNNISTQGQTLSFRASGNVSADQVRVAFTNDSFGNGFDRNLTVDRIEIDGTTFQTESPLVFGDGVFANGGITSGNFVTETLFANGFFQYNSDGNGGDNGDNGGGTAGSAGQIGFAVTQTTVNEDAGTVTIGLTRTEGSAGAAQVFFQTQDGTAIEGVDYVGNDSGVVNFADGQTFGEIVIQLIDNDEVDGDETFQLSLFRTVGASQGEPRTSTVTIVDDESGDGLIAYFQLDDTNSSGTIIDSSGFGNNGTALNFTGNAGPSTDTPDTNSPNSGSFRFDGINDTIRIGPSESLRLTEGRFSQSVWINPTSGANVFRSVIGFQAGANVGTRYPYIYTFGNDIYAGFGIGGNAVNHAIAVDAITVGTWNHVASSFDGETLELYVNGELAATQNFAGALPTLTINQFNIGEINSFFPGQIDEVRLYDRAISGAEVQALIDGATLPPPNVNGFFTTDVLATGLVQPTAVEQLPDGRYLVSEREGIIRVVNTDGTVNSTPLLDISEIVNRIGIDRGLMSIAIPANFETTRWVYVAYTYDPPEVQGQTGAGGPDGEGSRVARVSRFRVNRDLLTADRNSEEVILGRNSTYENIGNPNRRAELNDPMSGVDADGNFINDFIASDETSHTIGDIEFGSDGSLYVSVGDGGSFGRVDPVNLRALSLDSLNGKILRVNPNNGRGLSDNPFWDGNGDSNRSRVYSYGLRNPFRIAVQPGTDEIFIADVGWLNWEEINTGRGANFGWPAYEGFDLTGGSRGSYASLPETQAFLATQPEVTDPIYLRSHADGARAVILGDFIQGGDYPESLQGAFLFTDIGDQVLRAGRLDANGNLFETVPVSAALGFITDIMRMPDGSLIYVDFASGTIGELVFNE